jgi:hypothetical protein
VWDDKSRNILTHSKSLERQRDELAVELAAERTARKALSKALMICIRYADSSADTEQAYAALALAAQLPSAVLDEFAYETKFADGKTTIVYERTYSRACVRAQWLRMQDGAQTHKELHIVSGNRRTDLDADSSADTEQAHAALTLAAKLPGS